MDKEIFSNRLAELRIRQGISARDMSLSLGQNPGYINHIENSQALPSMNVFFNICDFLNITPQEFFETGNQNPRIFSEITDNLHFLNEEQLASIALIVRDLRTNKKL